MPGHDGGPLARQAGASTVWGLFADHARRQPDRVAVEGPGGAVTYGALARRAEALARVLHARGVTRGERVAILSENRPEYLEVFLAAARLGAIVACQNLRLAAPELAHCLGLVSPRVTVASPRHAGRVDAGALVFGADYEAALAGAGDAALPPADAVDPEDGLLILYTSGTTGLPKGAVISHRAEIARSLVIRAEFGIGAGDAFPAWSPLYHMGAADPALGTLLAGGPVVVVDGFDPEGLADLVATRVLGWLLVMPGTAERLADVLEARAVVPAGVRICGVMADLMAPEEVARVTRLLGAPFANTFGATETGCPPGSASPIPVGEVPSGLAKTQSDFCEVRLVDPEGREVADGAPGELLIRGPTLFSGYWDAPAANAESFAGGWFHMGDVFVRRPDGRLDFVDRVKYLIKSGGENVYPAEIERVIREDPGVSEVAVVRRPDPRWGEVPVAFVSRHDEAVTADALKARCRAALAGYKQPKDILFIPFEDFPRSTSGKIMRHELEGRLPGAPE